MKEFIILVDKNDKEIGSDEKLKVHKEGSLHRAFSIFIFNSKKELMLQQRAESKYHSAGLWSNTCCSHPRVGEETIDAAHRRLQEEMGFGCPLKDIFSFCYKANLDKEMIEHEYDHVFVGSFDGQPILNPDEACDYKWITIKDLNEDIDKNPERYSFWLKNCWQKVIDSVL